MRTRRIRASYFLTGRSSVFPSGAGGDAHAAGGLCDELIFVGTEPARGDEVGGAEAGSNGSMRGYNHRRLTHPPHDLPPL